MKNKLFEPNDSNKLFTITIEVNENIASTKVMPHTKHPTYHEVIGALETQKMHFIMLQREENMKMNKKLTKQKDEK